MKRHYQYLKYVLRHKCFVLLAGLKLGVPIIQLVFHDWDKFLPSMWIPYSNCFYKEDGTKQYIETEPFNKAWNSHQKRNKHHWQYWVLMEDSGNDICLRIPDKYLREMLADWYGAGLASGFPDTKSWYLKNKDNIRLNWITRLWIENELGV